MTFAQAVGDTPGLTNALRNGLTALRKRDRRRIVLYRQSRQRLRGSVNLERALKVSQRGCPLWDYAIGLAQSRNERIAWVEFHPASSNHVQPVLAKLDWLKRWLRESAPLLRSMPARYFWVASGKVAIQAGSPQRKRLAACGLQLAGERLQL